MKKYICMLSLSAFLLLLCGCGKSAEKSFENYSKEAFGQLISDRITLHSLLEDPTAYDIDAEDYPAFEDLTENGRKKLLDNKNSVLKKLDNFPKNQTALLLKNELEESISFENDYPYIKSYLGKNGASLGLLSSLSHYSLKNPQDINAYFSLLKAVPTYLNEILDYELRRQKAGYESSDYLKENELTELAYFLNDRKTNILITSFKERIDGLDLSKNHYIKKNESILSKTLYPAYESYVKKLSSNLKTSREIERYCQYEDGKNYYQTLIHHEIGSNLTIDQCKSAMEDILLQASSAIEELEKENPLIYDDYLTTELEVDKPEDMINLLKNNTLIEFPEIDEVGLTISQSDGNGSAYYLAPVWDAKEDNIIHLDSLEKDPAKLYEQLSHEGYPGHLYQINYFYQHLNNPLPLLFASKGCKEGWASYAEIYSYDFLPLKTDDQELKDQLQSYYKNKRLYEISLYSLCDLLVNGYDYNQDQLCSWLAGYKIDADQASLIYQEAAESPCSYLVYGIGYYEVMNLLEKYQSEKIFSLDSFHKWFLDCKSAPFYLIN